MTQPIFALVGPSGAGKTTIIKAMVDKWLGLTVDILKTITTMAPREPDDLLFYKQLTAMQYAEVEARGRLIQDVLYNGERLGNDSADVEAIEARGKYCITAFVEDGVMNFRTKGYEVVMIRIIPAGPYKPRKPGREEIDRARMLAGPRADAVVTNDFDSPNGLAEACAQVAGIIQGYLIPHRTPHFPATP